MESGILKISIEAETLKFHKATSHILFTKMSEQDQTKFKEWGNNGLTFIGREMKRPCYPQSYIDE